jgi:hypothetical protein
MRIVNVLFYFYMHFGETQYPLIMATFFSMPDRKILSDLCKTAYMQLENLANTAFLQDTCWFAFQNRFEYGPFTANNMTQLEISGFVTAFGKMHRALH